MITINQFSSGTAAAPARLPTPLQNVPDDVLVTRVVNEQTLTLASSEGSSAYVLTAADALAIMRAQFGSISTAFGDKALEVVDDALDFDTWRVMHIVMTGRDQVFNGKELRNYSSSDSDAVSVPAGGTVAVTFELIRSFEFLRLGARILEFCPGSEQARQLKWSFVRASGGFTVDSGKVTQSGTADNVLSFATEPFAVKVWKRVPRIFQNDIGGLTQMGPSGGLLAAWEASAAAASTSLGMISLTRKGGSSLHEQMSVDRIALDGIFQLPLGAMDPNSLVTMLWQPEPSCTLAQIPTATGWVLQQASNYLSMKSRWLFVPPSDEPYADAIARNLTDDESGPVMLSPAAASNPTASPGQVAISGLSIFRPSDTAYQLQPGRVYQKGAPPTTYVPQQLASGIKARVSGAGSADAARLAHEALGVGRYVPGGTSLNHGVVPPAGVAVLNHLAPDEGLLASTRALLTATK